MKPYYILYAHRLRYHVFYERFTTQFELEEQRQRVKGAGYRVIETGKIDCIFDKEHEE